MFNQGIYSTSFTSEAAERLFSNISVFATPDVSFHSTLRVLLHRRLPKNETVQLNCKGLQLATLDISPSTVSQHMDLFTQDSRKYRGGTGYYIDIVYTSTAEAGGKMLELVRGNAGSGKRYMSNYNRRDDLQVFFARKVNALFYTDDTEKNTIIFVDKLELKHFHALQILIPKYLPTLFADTPLTEAEIKLLKSTGGKSAYEYERLIEEFAVKLDIRAEIIRTKLAGFETGFERTRANELRSEISVYQNEYQLHLSNARTVADKIQECKYTLAGLECAIQKHAGDSEIMEYFMCNKNLTIANVSGTKITFIAHGYVDIYDLEALDAYADNLDGFFYDDLDSSVTEEQMEMLYMAIFSECRYKLRICAAYSADFRKGLNAIQDYIFPHESRTYFPNPHIQSHGCIGDYEGRFQEYMQKRDYVGAIDQAVVSARNLNFYDSAVISVFGRDFSRTSIKCLEKPDGTLLSPKEAIKELKGGA